VVFRSLCTEVHMRQGTCGVYRFQRSPRSLFSEVHRQGFSGAYRFQRLLELVLRDTFRFGAAPLRSASAGSSAISSCHCTGTAND